MGRRFQKIKLFEHPIWQWQVLKIVFAFALALVSAQLISALLIGFHSLVGGEGWKSSAMLHSMISVLVLVSWFFKGQLKLKFFGRKPSMTAPKFVQTHPYPLETLAAFLLAGSVLVSLVSQWLISENAPPESVRGLVPFILWVPVVEEICYRGILGHYFLRIFPGFLGIWFSAAVFALVHGDFTLLQLFQGTLAFPLGPFLLGVACATGYMWVPSLCGPILFHAVANGTVAVFTLLDPRWLDILSPLYQS